MANKIKCFGGNYEKRSKDAVIFKANILYAGTKFMNVGKALRFDLLKVWLQNGKKYIAKPVDFAILNIQNVRFILYDKGQI